MACNVIFMAVDRRRIPRDSLRWDQSMFIVITKSDATQISGLS